jgi:hypothetical protein
MKILALLTFLTIAVSGANAQRRSVACVKNYDAPPINSYYWPPDTEVKVYLWRGMFTAEQRATLLAAMESWTASASSAGAGVKFVLAGEVNRMVDCQGCLTVKRRDVHGSDPKHYAFFTPLRQDSDGLLISAWIDFDFATTNPQALQGFMAHELGHGLGLWDCTTCKKKKTIMNGFPGINRDNGLLSASECDVEVVKEVYQLQRRVSNNVVAERSRRPR